ncbi:MAG: hypothetical protein M3Q71_02710 [Chloroflexota bacterium]|nr:hypothetical protein [Chloroflexota bacterium]MDP9469563.1 hypothetical protein [Chloroflexota bacterium]
MREGFVTLGQAASRLGISDFALRDRLARGELVAYENPLDRRSRLLRLEDLKEYATPRPIEFQSQDERDRRTVA